jgi:hypothetical protein
MVTVAIYFGLVRKKRTRPGAATSGTVAARNVIAGTPASAGSALPNGVQPAGEGGDAACAHEAAVEPVAAELVAVAVEPAGAAARVPALPPWSSPAKTPGVSLDAAILEAKLKETAAVSALLATVFIDRVGLRPALPRIEGADCIPWLGADISALAKLLATKARWSRGELQSIATARAILLDGAIEEINDTAFDLCGEPALEGADPLEVNIAVLAKLVQRTVDA